LLENKSILIIGANGTIGSELVSFFESKGHNIFTTTRNTNSVSDRCFFLNLSIDEINLQKFNRNFDIVIICAAITSQKFCLNNRELSWRVNVENTVKIAKGMREAGAFIIFLSSNAVFNGELPFVNSQEKATPTTEYGCQKLEVENQLLKLQHKISIVRFSKVINQNMTLVNQWIVNLKMGRRITPLDDMLISPVPVSFAVLVLYTIVLKEFPGIVQVSSNQDITYADFARYIASKIGVDQNLISPISYIDQGFENVSKNTTLDGSALTHLGLTSPDVWKGIDDTFGFHYNE